MEEKLSQHHRQHFNLSESTKHMLDELAAQRYPGKQRRQSQLVEDLITEAFARFEHATVGTSWPKTTTVRKVVAETGDAYTTGPAPSGVCPTCARSVGHDWKYCVYCGASLAQLCIRCRTPRPAIEDARFCLECGESYP
jgi:hypothetical protein